ncbi:hypothetical protein [Hydrogenophaga electricum]|uniref:Uncharacterized protein n=1 Tax=Hydrogenophaga electricum TaxID=1230953 RepID=A0ABQ6C512_9BURK|nr:hypothetical protein [Hydrogenophaga electricum]GLS13302.1 hypothetical protein GCM10007935_07310 [Hydrogenophaga electricum]
MDDTDAFFTQTVVGPAQTVLMGRRLGPREAAAQGLQLDLTTGQSTLSRLWQDWGVLSHEGDAPGQPRRRPGTLRLRLERHALWIGAAGLLALIGAAAAWGALLWN